MTNQYDYVGTIFKDETDPAKITVALTMANQAAVAGNSAALILMIDAVYWAKPGSLQGMDIGAPFKPAQELLDSFLAHGGKILVCGSCMVHNGVAKESIDPRYEVITAEDVVNLLLASKGGLQIS